MIHIADCDGSNGAPDLLDRFVLGEGPSHIDGNSGEASGVTNEKTRLSAGVRSAQPSITVPITVMGAVSTPAQIHHQVHEGDLRMFNIYYAAANMSEFGAISVYSGGSDWMLDSAKCSTQERFEFPLC
ncbi:hypothetical protein [Burkholderia ubonensis]|uniref:hypothetical protein n=1 Tax=Burkholderia ubonensis TaxID=101571 RepID=UPI0012F905C9|nr:hypothetical protein [Burkholderia ubonensis]